MRKMVKNLEQIWSKGFGMYGMTLMILLVGGMLVTTWVQTGIEEWATYSQSENQSLRKGQILLDENELSLVVQNFDNVSNETYQAKVNELTPDQLSYVYRSGYTIYVIRNYDHLGSEAALTAQAEGKSVFVEDLNQTIWCHEKASKEEFSQVIDQFIEDQRTQVKHH